MKNCEKYAEKIAFEVCPYDLLGDKRNCKECEFDMGGNGCDFSGIAKWLLAEYVEPIKLTHDEYVILKNLPSEYKFLWRDLNEELYISENAPIIDENNNYLGLGYFADLPYNYDFLFVNCDEEPYEIAKLIADYEKENENGIGH